MSAVTNPECIRLKQATNRSARRAFRGYRPQHWACQWTAGYHLLTFTFAAWIARA